MRRLLFTLAALVFLPLLASAQEEKAKPGKARIPVFRLAGPVTETPPEELFALNLDSAGVSLKDLVARLNKAAEDPAVKAVVLLPEGATMGLAQIEEIRQALKKVRAAGKDVYAHADSLAMGGYTLLSGVSRLSVSPTGDLWIMGLSGESVYLRGLLDKLGVQPDFLTCGAYKSAAEVFMRKGPSPEAEKMYNWLFDGAYETMVKLIADGRKLKTDKVRELIDNGPYQAKKAKEAGLIDAVEQRQDFEALLKTKYGKDLVFDKKYGQKKHAAIDFTSPFAGIQILGELFGQGKKKHSGKDAVAIVYVDGAIVLGGGEPSAFSGKSAHSSDIRKALDEAAGDDSIKAVVLRVDSPGGSAVASEIILDATRRVQKKKPFVVSMGNVAGSGGYYVACAADTIFADDATITGSIGVVGGKLATTEMWNSIGVTFKAHRRGKNAGMLGSDAVFTKEERARMQGWMDEVYDVFKGHVVASRGKKLKKPIDDLAGGRVYTGRQALELGLVDKIGTLRDAIDHVAGQAKIKDYEIRVVPEPKNPIERLLEEATGEDKDHRGLSAAAKRTSLVELAQPYLRNVDPERVRLIVSALERLDLVRQEGVVLMMPEVRIGR